MLKSKKIVDWLYDYSLYFIIGALLLVIIAIEPSFVRVSNFTTILTQSATKIIYACGIAGIIVLGGTDLALGREVGLAAVVAASLLQAVDYSQRVFSADQVPALPLIVPLLLVMVLLGIICSTLSRVSSSLWLSCWITRNPCAKQRKPIISLPII